MVLSTAAFSPGELDHLNALLQDSCMSLVQIDDAAYCKSLHKTAKSMTAVGVPATVRRHCCSCSSVLVSSRMLYRCQMHLTDPACCNVACRTPLLIYADSSASCLSILLCTCSANINFSIKGGLGVKVRAAPQPCRDYGEECKWAA